MKQWKYRNGLLAGVLLLAAGCGTVETRMTVEQLTNARIAVEAAERAGAKDLSPENLRHAQDALAIANDAYAGKEFERSFSFAKKATIYARVAKSQSEQKNAEELLQSAQKELEVLRAQIDAEMAAAPELPVGATRTAQPALPAVMPAAVATPAEAEGK